MRESDLPARHFTTSAIHIIEQLWPRAADRSMPDVITAETITMLALWSLVRWEKKVGLVALAQTGVQIDALARAVDQALDEACDEIRLQVGKSKRQSLPTGQVGVTVQSDTAFEPLLIAAEHEALAFGHKYVGTDHLLLAIIKQACPRLQAVYQAHGVNFDQVRQAVLEISGPTTRTN